MSVLRLTAAVLSAAVAAALALWMLMRHGPAADPSSRPQAVAAQEFWTTYRAATDGRIAGDCRKAAVLYEKAVQLRPAHEDSLYYLGNCRFELHAWDEALDAYRRLAAINPDGSSRAYMQQALVHSSLLPGAPRNLREAERLFQRALDLDPDSGALLGLAEVALLQGRREHAQLLLERASAEDAMSMAAPYLLGYLAWKRQPGGDPWPLFRRAVERGEIKKPVVTWSEEGDVKADPALRWRALARQSVFGAYWIRLRAYIGQPGPARADMEAEYRRLDAAIARVAES